MSYKNLDVLRFYEHLPFNIHGDLTSAENLIKENRNVLKLTTAFSLVMKK